MDPSRQPAGERGVAGARRQRGLVGGEALEEALDRGRATARAGDELHARGPQPVAGDPVDEDRVEVVDGLLAVAAERVRGRRRERGGELGQLRGDGGVERRAPERVPRPVVLVEVRMDEPLGDGAVRELGDREGDAGGAAGLEPGRRGGETE